MFPEPLFHLGSWPVTAYLLCHALAVVVFAALVLAGQPVRTPLPPRRPFVSRFSSFVHHSPAHSFTTLCVVLAGAWLGSWALVGLTARSAVAGHSSLGAWLGVLAAAAWRARVQQRSVMGLLDVLAPALAAADATARLGCFFAGCCHGRPAWGAPWAVTFPMESGCVFPGVPVHPVQVCLSFGGFVLAALLLWLNRRGLRPGLALAVLLAGGGGLRLACDPLRSHAPVESPWPALHTLLAGAALLAGLTLVVWRHFSARRFDPSADAAPPGREVLESGGLLPLAGADVAGEARRGRGLPHSTTRARVRGPGFNRNPLREPAEAGTPKPRPA